MSAMPHAATIPDSADEAEIRRGIGLLFPSLPLHVGLIQPKGDIVEVRLIYDISLKLTDSGYFNNQDSLALALLHADQQNACANPHATGLYLTLNRVNPALLARAVNRIVRNAKRATKEGDILHRTLWLIDVDAKRPTGISATDDELRAALDTAEDIRLALLTLGFPEPLMIMSGSGVQILFAIDLPNDPASQQLLKDALAALAARYNSAEVEIDPSVADAPQLFKAPGTVARKGDHTSDRPHRMARILSAPLALEIVPRDLLEDAAKANGAAQQTAGNGPQEAAESTAQQASGSGAQGTYPPFGVPVDVNVWLAQHNLTARGPIPYNGGWKWILPCPFDPSHKNSVIIQTPPLYRPAFSCPHDSCKNAGHNWDALNCKFDPNYQSRENSGAARPSSVPFDSLTPGQLYGLQIPAPEILIDKLAPRRGCVLLTGVQKSGKTVLALQMAIAVARNKPLFDAYSIRHAGPVMIIEQDDPAGAASVREIMRASEVGSDEPIYFVPKNPSLCLGPAFIDRLENEITDKKLVLVILDSYTALRPSRTGGADIVKLDQGEMTDLDELGKRTDCLIIPLHHDSHAGAQRDWTARGAGTFGMTMATEAQIYISRYPDLPIGATERLVRLQGRHLASFEMTLRFNPEKLAYDWVLDGAGASLYTFVMETWRAFSQNAFTQQGICELTGLSRSTVWRHLAMLCHGSVLTKPGHGEYRFSRPPMR
jgi:hypothetical protein